MLSFKDVLTSNPGLIGWEHMKQTLNEIFGPVGLFCFYSSFTESSLAGSLCFGPRQKDIKKIEAYWTSDGEVKIVVNDLDLDSQLCQKIKLAFFEIKNETSEEVEKYIKEEISADELCIYLEVENGYIKLDRFKDPYVKTIHSILQNIQEAFIQKYDICMLPFGDAIDNNPDNINLEELMKNKREYKISRSENKNVVNNMYNIFIRKISDDIREMTLGCSKTTFHPKSIKIIIYDLHQFPLSKDELTLKYDVLWNK
jgi:hypothetical protein